MIHSKNDYRRHAVLGPGGWRCGCCVPPTSEARRIITKALQKQYRQKLKKLVHDELAKDDKAF